MSIAETNKIDIVGCKPDSSIVRLVITDHLDWADFESHARLLQEKINTYLDFVQSGQLARMTSPKVPANPEVHIVLALQHAPSAAAREFLAQVGQFILGIGLVFEVNDHQVHNAH